MAFLCKKRSSKSALQSTETDPKSTNAPESVEKNQSQIDQKLAVADTNDNDNTSQNAMKEEITLQESDGKEDDSKSPENVLYAGINPDPDKVETTMMKSQRTGESVHHVVHDVNWSGIFDESLLPNQSKWQFKPKKKNKVEKGKDAWTIEIFSPEECEKLIDLCEIYGFEDCGYPPSYRSNTRMITNDQAFADKLYERIKKCCPQKYKSDGVTWKICGLNERFRWCKYVKGQRFGQHCDARFTRSSIEESFYTVNVYLNDGTKDFSGGRTRFYNLGNKGLHDWRMSVGVVATPGLSLMFNQYPEQLRHDGEEVYHGVKYLMRTDVMYKCDEKEAYGE